MNNREYVQGNTVRKLDRREQQGRELREVSRKNRNNANSRYMNLGYVVFLSVAVCLVAGMLMGYIQDQSRLTISRKQVASMESELDSLRSSNDEALKRAKSAVSLDDIKQIAVEELGMTYAKEGQVIVIEDEGSDYVRQMKDLD